MVHGRRCIPVTAGLLTVASIVGCAGSSPWNSGGGAPDAAGLTNSERQPLSQLAAEFPSQTNLPAATQPLESLTGGSNQSENGFLTSMRSAGAAVADALTIKPKVIPAADPTSLSEIPEGVGGELHYRAARVSESQGNIPASISHYQQSLQIDPNNTRTLLGFARLLDRQQNRIEAESTYRRAIELEPQNSMVLNDLGMFYARQGNLAAAIEVLEQAVALQPSNQRYRNNLAIVLIDANQPREAFSHLAAVHGEAVAHYNLGFILSRRQATQQAISHFQQALVLNPNFEPARQMLASLRSGPNPSTLSSAAYDQAVLPAHMQPLPRIY